jgi:serine protease Do
VLVEFDGRVLGVLSANLATVVPLANYLAAAVRAMTTGVPAPGSLGIELHDLDAALSLATGASQGAIVSHVDASGPVASLLRVGDIVLTVQGQEVLSASRLAEWLRATEPGTTVALQVRRGDDVYDLEVPVVPAVPAVPIERSPAASARPSGHGMTLRERAGSEVFVVRVAAGSAAADAGIVAGDVIAWMAGTERPTAAAVRRLYSEAQPGSAILISVTRDRRHRVLALEKR